MKLFWFSAVLMGLISCGSASGFELLDFSVKYETDGVNFIPQNGNFLMVDLTLIQSAGAKGAGKLTSRPASLICLPRTLPGFHLHRGHGSGADSWLIQLEGGGWCNTVESCVDRKNTSLGSSNYMEKQLPFIGILSNKTEENPVFYNWNRVKVRYCDGASFSGNGEDKAAQLQFRGQKIWLAAMEELMSIGMQCADQVLLSGCSAGGLAAILHCDEFRALFPRSAKVKCLGDAALFLDVTDISGGHSLRDFFSDVVELQGVEANLPSTCTNQLDPALCFFPQNLISSVKTPLFLLNTAYDTWQIQQSLVPPTADPQGYWFDCKLNHSKCDASQIQFLQGFRKQMLNAIKDFSRSPRNGLFINSCFAHCQGERGDSWFAENPPVIGNKAIATAVGDWYFDRATVKAIDCPYPCDKTCSYPVIKQ